MAIRKAIAILNDPKKLKGAYIYVCRVNKEGELKYSKPCPDCMSTIEKYGMIPMWSDPQADKEISYV